MRDFVNPMLESWAGRVIVVVTVIMLLVIGGYWYNYYSSLDTDLSEQNAPGDSAEGEE